MSKKAKTTRIEKDKLYVVSAFSFLLVLFGLYVYFVSASILHVVMQQEMQRNVSLMHTEISKLEAEYIDAQHALSDEIALMNGYEVANDKIFIDRSESALVLRQVSVQ